METGTQTWHTVLGKKVYEARDTAEGQDTEVHHREQGFYINNYKKH